MGNRLTKITTRTGDGGETGLGDGSRVAKDAPLVALIGEIDELNSWIGVVRAHGPGPDIEATLEGVQHDLFDFGGALSMPGFAVLSDRHVLRLDEAVATLNEGLAPLRDFVLPGGAPLVAWLHIARTVARRAERLAVAVARDDDGLALALQYLNRLSDYLFIAARAETARLDLPENIWRKDVSLSQP